MTTFNWRFFWITAPGAMVAGISHSFTSCLFLLPFYKFISYRELVSLACLFLFGLGLPFRKPPEIVSGRVSLVERDSIHVKEEGGRYWKIRTSEAPLPGSWIKARVKWYELPALPRGYRAGSLKLEKYLEIRTGEEGIRQKICDASYKHMSEEAAAIANALLIGVNRVPEELRASFSSSGLSHLLAISGLHVGMLCGGTWRLARRIFVLLGKGEVFSLISSLLAGACYAGLAGFGTSLMRALLMFFAAALGWYRGRTGDPIRICGAVACLLLTFYPEEWNSPAFLFSFLATAGLLAGKSLLSLHFLMLPYISYFFFQIPLQPLFANLLALPLLTFFLMPLLLFNFFAWGMGIYTFFSLLEWGLKLLIWIAEHSFSFSIRTGMQQSDLGIQAWTLSLFAFFLVQRYLVLLPGGACFLLGLYPFREQIAMKHYGTFGLWDGRCLWVSNKDAWVVKKWSDAFRAQEIRLVDSEDSRWRIGQGYLWLGHSKPVWFGKKQCKLSEKAKFKLWKSFKPERAKLCEFGYDSVWIYLDSERVWIPKMPDGLSHRPSTS